MIDDATRQMVRARARGHGEYCRLSQAGVEGVFHVEHIIAQQHGGTDDLFNLALACDRCNLYKGPNLTGIDPQTQMIVRLFNPRDQDWNKHFEWRGLEIIGQTAAGRATVRLLQMNNPRRTQLRAAMRNAGEF